MPELLPARPRWTRCGSRWSPPRSRRCCASCSAGRSPSCWPAGGCPGCRVLRSVVLLPLVLPPVVGGLALLFLLGRTGLLGSAARPLVRHHDPVHHRGGGAGPDVRRAAVPGGQPGGGAAHGGQRYEAVAATLGASPGYAFRRVTVPLVLPGLASGRGAGVRPLPGRVRRDDRRSPAACRAPRGRCRCWSTWSARPTSTRAVALSLLLVVVAVVVIAVGRGPRVVEGCTGDAPGSTRPSSSAGRRSPSTSS